ncbi:O-antigen ligase family protein [Polaribacter sp. Asnod6-C07]|uniref:O-antigen ligase family protein n=1 Tax=Polaribacter sp. Asnod6-C07 TaxID=3160582 RepID=UPI00386A3697
MRKINLILLSLALVFPFERLSYFLLIFFFIVEIILSGKSFIKKLEWKTFFNPVVLLFYATLILMKLRDPIGGWDRDLTLFLFPIYFSVRKLKKNEILLILKSFVLLLLCSLIFLFIYEFVLQFVLNNYLNLWKLEEHYNNYRIFYFFHIISERVGFHHIYLSLYLFIGFIAGHYLIYSNSLNTKWVKFVKLSMMIFLIFTFLSISRMSIICFSIYGLFMVFKLFQKRINKRYLIFILSICSLIIILSSQSSVKNKFYNISNDSRIYIFKTSYQLGMESYLKGHGMQKGREKLIEKQKKIGNSVLYTNAHNQYLDYFVSGGIIMLVIFLIITFRLIVVFYRGKAYLGLAFILFFLLQCFTEALMERFRGIVLFSFFVSLIYQDISNDKKRISFFK